MTVLIGERYWPKLAQSLAAQGIDAIWLPDNAALDKRLSSHADLSVFVCGNNAVVARALVASNFVKYLTNRGYIVAPSAEQGADYPRDAGLCVCWTGRYTIYNEATADPAVLDIICGVPVHVSQGYTKCAALVVDDHSIVTADAGVSRAAKSAGMDVLEITPGHIALDGFEYGFIGGASFIISDNTVAFTGTLDGHPDKDRILDFLAQHGKKPVFLTDEAIFDIGGAISV